MSNEKEEAQDSHLSTDSSPLFRGIDEFNHGHFFEAHELWEEVWNDTVGEEKRFYQGLIHIAAGYAKLSIEQYNGARKLLERGRQIVAEFPSHYMGVDLASLLATTATLLRDLAMSQTVSTYHTPELHLLDSLKASE